MYYFISRAEVSLDGIIPPLVKNGGSGRINVNKKREGKVRLDDYEEEFIEVESGKTLEGPLGKLEKTKTMRSRSTRTITLDDDETTFALDITQTIEFFGRDCETKLG